MNHVKKRVRQTWDDAIWSAAHLVTFGGLVVHRSALAANMADLKVR
jgi:hypothetical protein